MIEPQHDLLIGSPTGDPSWTETWWYPLYVPDAGVSAYLYAVVRPTTGTAAGGVIVWDESTDTLFDALFADYRWNEPFEHDGAGSLRFRSGLSVDIVEPLVESRIRYVNPDEGAEIDVTFRATSAAHEPSRAAQDKGIRGHFDQPGVVQGTVRVNDRSVDVESHAVRDRSWGPRPDAGRRWWGDRIGYSTGATHDFAFLAVSHPKSLDSGEIFDGFLDRAGDRRALRAGARHLRYRPDGRIDRVDLELEDEAGHAVALSGRTLNRCTFQSIPAMMTTVSMIEWDVDGEPAVEHAVGEDQDVWWQHSWRRFARSRGR